MCVYDSDLDFRHGMSFLLPIRLWFPLRLVWIFVRGEAAHSAASSAEVKWLIFTLQYASTAFTATSLIVSVIIIFHFRCICFFTWFIPRNKQNLSICWHFSLQCPLLRAGVHWWTRFWFLLSVELEPKSVLT
jgi:hypothetical protein